MGDAMLVPLYDLTQQFNNKNGAVLVGGRLYVYYIGRTELATTWADEDAAAQNTNPVLLDNNGRAPVFVDDSYSYTLVVCDRAGTELFSQDITPGGVGSVGGRIVYHDETLSGAGTVSSLLGVVNIPLGVDETMTAYTGVAEGKDALILGVNGDWFNETFSGEFDQKVDWEDFSACCSAVKNGLENKLDASAINNYYTKNEVDGRTSSFVNYNFLSGNYYNKFETSSREELYSAFLSAGQGGGGEGDRTPWISGSKTISSMSYLQPGQWFQVLSSFDLSGVKNHCICVKGGAYNFPTTAMFYDWLDLGQYMPQTYFDNFISGSYQPNINSLFNSAGWMMYNKLDISAFTAWSAEYAPDEAETYTVTGGNWIDISADDNEKVTTISVTGLDTALNDASGALNQKIDTVSSTLTDTLTGFSADTLNALDGKKNIQNNITLTSTAGDVVTAIYQNTNGEVSADFAPMGESFVPWISGTKSIADTQTLTGNMLVQVLSSFDLSGYKNHSINVNGGIYRFPNNYEIASGINQTNTFLTQSAFNNYTNVMSNHLSILYGQDGYLSGRINELSSYAKSVSSTVKSNSGLWNQVNTAVNNYVTTKSANIDLATSLVIDNETNWSDTTYTVSNNSAKWDDATNKVRSNSAQWAKNDGDSAVNNWVYNHSATCETTNTTVGLNSNFWSNTCLVVMDNSASWGQGGTSFPITSQSGSTLYTLNASSNAIWLTSASGPAGATTRLDVKGVKYDAYPATNMSASWYNIISAANSKNITCSAVKLTTATNKTTFYTSALPNLNKITFIAPTYGPYQTYSALIADGKTIFCAEVNSGCCRKVVRCWNDDRNKNCWCGLNQETYFSIG